MGAGFWVPRVIRCAAGSLALLGALSSKALAQPVELSWQAPPECPGLTQIQESVERALGAPLSTTDVDLAVTGQLTTEIGATWRVDLEMTQARTTRHRKLTGATCLEVSEAASLVIAVAIDPKLAFEEPAEPAPPAAAVLAEPLPMPANEAPPLVSHVVSPAPVAPATWAVVDHAPAPATTSDLEWSLGAAAALDSGALPEPSIGARGAFGLAWESTRFELAGSYFMPRRGEVGDSGVTADFRLWTLGLAACWLRRAASFDVGLCPRLEAGELYGEGVEVTYRSARRSLWMAAELQAVAWLLGSSRAAVGGGLSLATPLVRRQFVVTNAGEVHRADPLLVRAFVGAEARFQ